MPQNKIIKRTLLNRALTHQELDNNFQYGNFWEANKTYREDMVVIYNDEIYRALGPTTIGSFVPAEWQIISNSGGAGGTVLIGIPTDGNYGADNEVIGEFTGMAPGDTIEDALDKIETFLGKLAPAKAPLIGSRSLNIPNLWSAKELTSGTSRTNITVDTQPIGTVSDYFSDGGAGILKAFINGNAGPTVNMVTGTNQSGTYSNAVAILTVNEIAWPQSPATPFWEALGATIRSATALSGNNILHTYQINHDTPNSSVSASFYVDTLATPSITPETLVGVHQTTAKYISGVPSLRVNDLLRCTYKVNNAISYFYNSTRITSVSSSFATGANVPTSPIPNTFGQIYQVTNFDIPVIANVTTENANVSYSAWNARGTVGTDTATILTNGSPNIRIDTLSNESNRLTSGVGQFPTIGSSAGQAGSTFDPSISLSTAGNEELQMYFGNYRYPTGNYTLNAPTVGPNYTSVPAGSFNNIRWVTLNVGNTSGSVNSVTLTFQSPVNFGSTKIIPNFYMYVRVVGIQPTAGWVDGNLAYNSGNPTNDGDAAYNFGSSTVTTRNITFGTSTKTGTVYVRVGIPVGSTIQFKNITLS